MIRESEKEQVKQRKEYHASRWRRNYPFFVFLFIKEIGEIETNLSGTL